MTLKDTMAADFQRMLDDLPAAITYRSVESAEYVPSSGSVVREWTDVPLNAIRQDLNEKAIALGHGVFLIGDVIFLVAVSDLGAVTPKGDDRIIDGSTTFEVAGWTLEEDENVYRIHARRV